MEDIVVRKANRDDAARLYELNREFNGNVHCSVESIEESLENNPQEVVFLVEYNHSIVGFACVHIKKSICYASTWVELAELYVNADYRRKGLATKLVSFAEKYCVERYRVRKIEILTGQDNLVAQAFYRSLEYIGKGEVQFIKRISNHE